VIALYGAPMNKLSSEFWAYPIFKSNELIVQS